MLVGNNIERIREEYKIIKDSASVSPLGGKCQPGKECAEGVDKGGQAGRVPQRPELWDGDTAARCVEAIINHS